MTADDLESLICGLLIDRQYDNPQFEKRFIELLEGLKTVVVQLENARERIAGLEDTVVVLAARGLDDDRARIEGLEEAVDILMSRDRDESRS